MANLLALAALLAARMAAAAGGVLVVAPHPDDEVLSAGGVLKNALDQGREVNVVVVTNGDFFGTDYGLQREGESVAALGVLGLGEAQVVFLGYPDGGTLSLWNDAPTTAQTYLSPRTGRQATYGNRGLGGKDFHTFLSGQAGPYNRPTLVADVRAALERFRPADVLVTGEFDQHTDHRTTFYAVRDAATALGTADPTFRPTIHTTIVHDPLDYPYDDFWPLGVSRTVSNTRGNDAVWPNPSASSGVPNRFDPTASFVEPPSLGKTILDWAARSVFPVPAAMTDRNFNANLKIRSLQGYASQASDILWAHAKADEFFWSDRLRIGVFRNNVARGAAASASSAAPGQSAQGAVDGVVDGAPNAPGAEWAAAGPGAGASLRLAWPSPLVIDRVVLHDRVDLGAHVTAGHLSLDDGTQVPVAALANDGRGDEIVLATGHRVSALTFTVDAADGTPGLAELEVFGAADAVACSNTAQCPAGGPCAAAACRDGYCAYDPAPDGTGCGDANACNGVEACHAGVCQRDPAPSCDDGDPCTADVCASPGTCTHRAACTPVPVKGRAGCRLAFVGLPTGICEDGDPACDQDETTDGGCRFDLILCANMGVPGAQCDLRKALKRVVARSRRVPEMTRLTSMLGARMPLATPSCVGPTSVRVPVRAGSRRGTRRRVHFVVTTTDGHRLRTMVTLACRPAPPGVQRRPPAPLSP